MKRVLLILAAAILALSAQAYTLTPDRTELQWDDWDINIKSLVDTNAVGAGTFRAKEAGDDSLFVQMLLTVKNNSHKGFSFAPSAVVRLIIGENEFDAENLESSDSYVDNIEPTLVRERDCYFEVPKALFKDSFTLRFSALLTESAEVHVSIAKPMPTPIPTPTPASTPEPLSNSRG